MTRDFFQFMQALDMHLSVVILRVEKGLDYSKYLNEDGIEAMVDDSIRPIPPNDSTTDLLTNVRNNVSNESLNRNDSQGKRDVFFMSNKSNTTKTFFEKYTCCLEFYTNCTSNCAQNALSD